MLFLYKVDDRGLPDGLPVSCVDIYRDDFMCPAYRLTGKLFFMVCVTA